MTNRQSIALKCHGASRIFIMTRCPFKYMDCCKEYEWNYVSSIQRATYLEVWLNADRSDKPFKYVPTEQEQIFMGKFCEEMRQVGLHSPKCEKCNNYLEPSGECFDCVIRPYICRTEGCKKIKENKNWEYCYDCDYKMGDDEVLIWKGSNPRS